MVTPRDAGGAVPPETARRAGRSRGLGALGIAAAVVALAAVAGVRGCKSPGPVRTVRVSSAPEQVVPPGGRLREATGEVRVGDRAPKLPLADLAGQLRPLDDLAGHVVVLNMWASWCPPCVAEMPSLERLHREAGPGVVVVGVAVDDPVDSARAFVERQGLTFRVLLDPGGDACASWGTVKFPETWVIDATGIVRERVIGGRDWSDPSVLTQLRALGGAAPG